MSTLHSVPFFAVKEGPNGELFLGVENTEDLPLYVSLKLRSDATMGEAHQLARLLNNEVVGISLTDVDMAEFMLRRDAGDSGTTP